MPDGVPPEVHALGFSYWKRTMVRRFLAPSKVRFVRRAGHVPPGSTVAVWASGPQRDALIPASGVQRLFLEDGFLRSVGLGADLVRPVSWVVDTRGIYYDATRPSDLEHLLQHAHFAPELLARAGALRTSLVAGGLTKYNVGAGAWQRPAAVAARGQDVVLVPGQVETDASLRLGAPATRTNLDLLKAVRAARPAAWLVYKPHPDVVAGLRNAGLGEGDASKWCDEVVEDVSMGALLNAVDEVHVLTSLAGFEALLRGKRVVCHGVPFYAGWGLTLDLCSSPRRTRRLCLDELVAAALLVYPSYVSRETRRACSAEQALAELTAWKTGSEDAVPWWRRLLRPWIRHK